jgi:hypothetical protein
MHHAEWLIGRIVFLEGTPVVSKLNAMKIGGGRQVAYDEEAGARRDSCLQCRHPSAHGSRRSGTVDLLTRSSRWKGHVDWNERQRDQIAQMGLEIISPAASRAPAWFCDSPSQKQAQRVEAPAGLSVSANLIRRWPPRPEVAASQASKWSST